MKTKRIQIKDLKVGMKIKTYNPITKSIVFSSVSNKWDTIVDTNDQRIITFMNGTILKCSKNHPIMVLNHDDVVQKFPDDIQISDKVITDSGVTNIISVCNDFGSEDYIDITVENHHTFFASNDVDSEMILTHNSQGGVRGGAATLHYPIWHYEVEDLLVLKNNKGTEDNRIRHMDYSVQFNKVMYERLLSNGNITLFSPSDVPDLYEAFFVDVDKFRTLYEKYERSTKIRKKIISAVDLFSMFMQERKDTGRIYLMNVDHANDHGSFIKELAPIRMSNLCVSGDTWITVQKNDGSIEDIQIKDADVNMKVFSRNIKIGKNEFRQIKAAAMTRENAPLMKITDENNNSITCTPEHKIYTKNRGYVEAKHLLETDELLVV
jgi:hypothetical protein